MHTQHDFVLKVNYLYSRYEYSGIWDEMMSRNNNNDADTDTDTDTDDDIIAMDVI